MTRSPLFVRCGDTLAAALATIAGRKISELPVLDEDGRPAGMIDITDLVASMPLIAERPSVPVEAALAPAREQLRIFPDSQLRETTEPTA